jgi:tetratricopeptide (TPR) repeat protein
MLEILVGALGQMLGELLGEPLDGALDRRARNRALGAAVKRAEQRFVREYRARDAELTDALFSQAHLAELPSVRAALHDLLTHPFHDPSAPVAAIRRSFSDVLPARIDRDRVDAAVALFLQYVGQEVLYIPQLQKLYALAFQKASAESSRKIAASTAALAQDISELRDDLRQLPAATPPPALPAPARPRPWHNLPQRSYTRFVGRHDELEKLTQLLLPYPRSRHFLVTLDGIGGVGKSALALELAYRYRDGYEALPPDQRFAAIAWVSAKRTLLTASGIQQRPQTFSTLGDLYREIATVLDEPAILQADPAQRRGLVERALASQRTLLIVDNLETIDDEELLTCLRELPDPTKVIVTTRHRIDIAYAIRLVGMPQADAQALMMVEAARKHVDLPPEATDDLYRRTGGIPLAIVWSIGLIGLGHSVESVLRRLGSGHSDIARFCFAESVARIRDRDAYRVLLALALFERSVNRQMLGEVAGLGDDAIGRDDALAELLQLSLVEQKSDRFKLLPLTHSYALEELAKQPELERELRERWIACLTELARPYADLHWQWPDRRPLKEEGLHLVTLASWSQQTAQPDVLLPIMPAVLYYYDLVGQWTDLLNFGQIGIEYARLLGNLHILVFIETHMLAWVLSRQGDHDEAERYILDALDIARQIGDIGWECTVLLRYALVLRRRGEMDKAFEYCQQVIQLLPRLTVAQQVYVRADVEYELGKIARDRGDWLAAQAHFLAARDVFRHDESGTALTVERSWSVIGHLGFVAHQLGDLDTAAQLYLQCLDFFREAGTKGHMTTLLIHLAWLEEQRGNRAPALGYAREALEWSQRLGMVRELQQAQAIVGRVGV